ncbi:MAG: CvpA family protein [Muribaculaceae bacterium]|nr:CvpA family protein [Muribaculaceae bacterium]
MSETGYHIIVLAVAAFSVIKGFRRGFTGQISGILGFAFGTVSAHIFETDVEIALRFILPWVRNAAGSAFVYSVLSSVIVYSLVYNTFKIFTKVLRSAMQVFYVGMLDSILGAMFSLLKYMLLVSIVYNLLLCINHKSTLLKYASADDGNIVESVVLLAPGLLGCGSVHDLSHLLQLHEAKKISCNITTVPLVITYESHNKNLYANAQSKKPTRPNQWERDIKRNQSGSQPRRGACNYGS